MLSIVKPENYVSKYRVLVFYRKEGETLNEVYSSGLHIGCGIVSFFSQHCEVGKKHFTVIGSSSRKMSVAIQPLSDGSFVVEHFGQPKAVHDCKGQDLVKYLRGLLEM